MKNEKLTRIERLHAQRRKDRQRKALRASSIGLLSLSVLTASISPALAAVDGNGKPVDDPTVVMPSQGSLNQKPDGMTDQEYKDAINRAGGVMTGEVQSMSISDADKKRLAAVGYTLDLDKSVKESNEADEGAIMVGKKPFLRLTGSTNKAKVEQAAVNLLGDDYGLESSSLETLADQETYIAPDNITTKELIRGADQIKARTQLSPISSFSVKSPESFHNYYSKEAIEDAKDDTTDPAYADEWLTAYPSVGYTNEVAKNAGSTVGTAVYDVYGNSLSSVRTDYLKETSTGGRAFPLNQVSCVNNECGGYVLPTVNVMAPDGGGGAHSATFALTAPVWVSVKTTYTAGDAPELGKENATKTENGGLLWFTKYEGLYDEFINTDAKASYWNAETLTPYKGAEEQEQLYKLWNNPSLIIEDITKDGPQVSLTNGGLLGATVKRLDDDGSYSIKGGSAKVLLKTGEYSDGTPKTTDAQEGLQVTYTSDEGDKYLVIIESSKEGSMTIQVLNKKNGVAVNGPSYNVQAVMNVSTKLTGRDGAVGFGYTAHYEAPSSPQPTPTPSKPSDEPTPTPTPTVPEKTPTPTPTPSKPSETPTPTPIVPEPTKSVKVVDPTPPSETPTPSKTPTPEKVKKEQKKESVKENATKTDSTSTVEKPKSGAINAGANKGVVASIVIAGILFMAAVCSSIGYLVLGSRSRREESESE